jgi:hypothetical protein
MAASLSPGHALRERRLTTSVFLADPWASSSAEREESVRRGNRDYTRLLTEAIAEAKAAGLESAARELERACFGAAFTTSTEMLGEHGVAIKRFLKVTRGTLTRSTRAKLEACLLETELAWPGWRNLPALLKWFRARI